MQITTSSSVQFSRLPKTIKPVNYALEFKPDFETFKFSGSSVTDIIVESETTTIELNSADLTFDKVEFVASNGTKLMSSEVKLCQASEVATIVFPSALPLGAAKLSIQFVGCLNDELKGFYRSKYTHPNGETRWAATTQFEAADARRAFPCWDEPALKATFDVTIVAHTDKTVISNMPLIDTKPCTKDSALSHFTFSRTPIMSTYLLAFIVGEYDYVEDKDSNGVLIRCYTPLGKKEQGKFALNIATKTLPFYVNYFKIDYPLPKLDMIAIPDFSAGAMENWGLVTYRETCILVDEVNSSLSSKQTVAIVVGHELAHQWFGNIVTMEWWTHLWLNEGFASWIEYLCVDYCMPEMDIWTHFVFSDYTRALELDSLRSSHPIEVPVNGPSEIDEIFDAISYSKGATVIRMLHNYIGDDAFRTGLHNYLEKFKYKNTFTEDLWAALSEASGKDVNDLMQLWTKQTGYPYINVSSYVNDKKETILKLSQKRFFSDGSEPTQEEDYKWKVPISIVTKSSFPNTHKDILLEKVSDEVNLGVMPESDWIKLNKSSIGMFRTNYSPEMLLKLVEVIKEQKIHPTDRLGLQSDVFALSQAGLLTADTLLKFIESYSVEENVTVWRDLLSNLLGMSHILLNTNFHHEFQSFIRRLLKPISQKLGYSPVEGESGLTGMCRATILRTLGTNGDLDTINVAKKQFEDHLNGKLIPADLRSAVYSTVLSEADEALLTKFIELHDKTDLQEEKMRIATSLGSVKNEKLIEKVLEFSISPSVRSQDSVTVICGVSSNPTTKRSADMAWSFLKKNWTMIHQRYSSGFLITRLVKTLASNFATEDDATDVKEFFEKNPCPSATRSIQQALENIDVCCKWLCREQGCVKCYLNASA